MPLIQCPDCHAEVSDRAPACPRCGGPIAAAPTPPPAPPAQAALQGHNCIFCGSSNLSYGDDSQGFGAGKAIAGAMVFGPLGLLAGTINKNKRFTHVRCNQCLRVFTADKMLRTEQAPALRAAKEAQEQQFFASLSPVMVVLLTFVEAFVFCIGSYFVLPMGFGFLARFSCLMVLTGALNVALRKSSRRSLGLSQDREVRE